nr:hypothetical protein CFP56_68651 [Quercus suber]
MQCRTAESKSHRLSNVRKSHPVTALSFQASDPASAPIAKPRRSAPFILEDDEDDSLGSAAFAGDQASNLTASYALKERSPNASPRKSASTYAASEEKTTRPAPNVVPPLAEVSVPTPPPSSRSPSQLLHPTTSSEPTALPAPSLSRPANELAADLASLISRSASRAHDGTISANPLPAKRKNRPLGRNLSGSNARSSCSASVEPRPSMSPPPVPELLGTQIGYQNVDADAHRQLMEKRMNVDLRDPSAGQCVPSVGTLTDGGGGGGGGGGSAARYAGEGRRERHRPR